MDALQSWMMSELQTSDKVTRDFCSYTALSRCHLQIMRCHNAAE